jgi:two-component system, response regulator
MGKKFILLVEDNPDDEALTLRAFKQNRIDNGVVVTRDGAEALDYLFGKGKYAGRDLNVMPTLILLDLKLPKVDGLEVLRQLRANPLTALLPGLNSYILKPVDFDQFTEAVRSLGRYWLAINEAPPTARRAK